MKTDATALTGSVALETALATVAAADVELVLAPLLDIQKHHKTKCNTDAILQHIIKILSLYTFHIP